jgi:hypothetical protein
MRLVKFTLFIHDRALSPDVGFANFDGWMEFKGGTEYARIPVGDGVDL